jgi:hypothetical protein
LAKKRRTSAVVSSDANKDAEDEETTPPPKKKKTKNGRSVNLVSMKETPLPAEDSLAGYERRPKHVVKFANAAGNKAKGNKPFEDWEDPIWILVEIKVGICKAMQRRKSPKRTWCYCGEWVTASRLTALNIPQLEGRVPEEAITGNTPDISPYAQFNWYKYVWYYDPVAQFLFKKKLLGQWLGVAARSTDIMAFYILTETDKVIVRKSIWGLSMEEMKTREVQLQVAGLNLAISQKIGDAIADNVLDPYLAVNYPDPPPDEIFDGDEALDEREDPDGTHVEADDYTPGAYEEYLLAEILLPHDGELKSARVRNWVKDADGRPVGKRNANPLLYTREYEVEFLDGSIDALQVNIIAENMFSQIDNEGQSYAILQEIVDHRKNGHALTADDSFYTAKNGRRHAKHTT